MLDNKDNFKMETLDKIQKLMARGEGFEPTGHC